jgi:hypothetical protein
MSAPRAAADNDESGGEHFDHLYRMVDGVGAFTDVRKPPDDKNDDIVGLILEDSSGCGLSSLRESYGRQRPRNTRPSQEGSEVQVIGIACLILRTSLALDPLAVMLPYRNIPRGPLHQLTVVRPGVAHLFGPAEGQHRRL